MSWLHLTFVFSTKCVFFHYPPSLFYEFYFPFIITIINAAANDISSVAHICFCRVARFVDCLLRSFVGTRASARQRLLFCSFEHFYACALVIICSISQISCFWECCVSRTDCGRLAVDMRTGMCAFVYIWASNSSKWHRNSYALFIDWRWFYSFSSFLTCLLAYLFPRFE